MLCVVMMYVIVVCSRYVAHSNTPVINSLTHKSFRLCGVFTSGCVCLRLAGGCENWPIVALHCCTLIMVNTVQSLFFQQMV